MTESNELDQVAGQITGLIDTVRALQKDEIASWVCIIQRLLQLPEKDDLELIYVYMMGKALIAQTKKTEESKAELNKFISAGEVALHQVTHIRKMFDVQNYYGPFTCWEREYRQNLDKEGSVQKLNRLLYHLAFSQTSKK